MLPLISYGGAISFLCFHVMTTFLPPSLERHNIYDRWFRLLSDRTCSKACWSSLFESQELIKNQQKMRRKSNENQERIERKSYKNLEKVKITCLFTLFENQTKGWMKMKRKIEKEIRWKSRESQKINCIVLYYCSITVFQQQKVLHNYARFCS